MGKVPSRAARQTVGAAALFLVSCTRTTYASRAANCGNRPPPSPAVDCARRPVGVPGYNGTFRIARPSPPTTRRTARVTRTGRRMAARGGAAHRGNAKWPAHDPLATVLAPPPAVPSGTAGATSLLLDHPDLDLRSHIGVEADGDAIDPERADRLVQVDLALFDVMPLGLELMRDVGGRDGAE